MTDPQRQPGEGPQSLDYATPQSRRRTRLWVVAIIVVLLVAALLVAFLLVKIAPR
jgi:hypothetical protein